MIVAALCIFLNLYRFFFTLYSNVTLLQLWLVDPEAVSLCFPFLLHFYFFFLSGGPQEILWRFFVLAKLNYNLHWNRILFLQIVLLMLDVFSNAFWRRSVFGRLLVIKVCRRISITLLLPPPPFLLSKGSPLCFYTLMRFTLYVQRNTYLHTLGGSNEHK